MKKSMNFIFLISLILSGIITAKDFNDIRGYVVDQHSGESLPNANVIIPEYEQGSATNSEGYFVLVNIPTGQCTLQVSYIGYETEKVIINNKDNDEDLLKIELHPTSLGMSSLQVVADKYEVMDASNQEVSQVTLSTEQLKFLPSLGETDIFHSLKLLPGISNVGEGKGGLYIRGGTPNQNMTTLDGMTLYHVDHFFGMFSAFNSNAIKDVQVYKGGYPAEYGGRLSSVIELTGKQGGHETQLDFGANLLSANVFFSTPLFKNKGSFLISARRSYTDLIQTSFYQNMFEYVTGEESTTNANMAGGGSGPGRPGSNALQEEVGPTFHYYDLNSKLSYNPTKRDFLSLSFYAGQDVLDNSSETTRDDGFQVSGQEAASISRTSKTDWGNVGGSFKWAHQWGSRLFTNTRVSYSEFISDFNKDMSFGGASTIGFDDSTGRGVGSFAQNEFNNVKDLTLKIDNNWQINPAHNLNFGLDISNINTEYNASMRDTLAILDINSNATSYCGYIQDRWNVNPIFNIAMGLRSNYFTPTNKSYTAPRLSADYRLTDKFTLKAAWGKYFQFVNSISNENVLEGSDKFWLTADKNMKPSYAYHNIAGITYETNNYLFEIQGYYKTLSNLIEFTRRFHEGADFNNYFFFGDGIAKGIEFLAQKKFGNFKGWISYTLGNVEYTFPGINDGESYPASHDRTHELKTVGTYKWKNWTFSATWVYTTGSPYTAPESQYYLTMLDGTDLSYFHVSDKNVYRMPDYHRLDISASRQFETEHFNWDAGLSIYNLYNRDNVAYREYNLDVTPIVVSDVNYLGFTPSLFIKLHLK